MHQHALGSRQVDAFEQRAGDGLLGGDARTVRAAGRGRAHHGLAGLAHHGAHVFEVHVHLAVFVDDFSDTAHGVLEHIIGVCKGFVLGDVIAQHIEQLFVEHHDQRIHIGFQLGQAFVGILHAAATFPVERLGHHTHGQNTHLLGNARDHRGRPRARATAHARRDEQHVRALDGVTDVFHCRFGCIARLFRLAACPQTTATQLDDTVGRAARERLRVGIGADKLHALHAAGNHVLDGIAAATAHTDHLDLGALVEFFGFDHFDGHLGAPVSKFVGNCHMGKGVLVAGERGGPVHRHRSRAVPCGLPRANHKAPTLATACAALPPKGAFAPWGGPAALIPGYFMVRNSPR